ncbi:hypothetical protein L0657_06710 [Dyadobacter sp. CY345]|uniref:hypothetical protein n=1 Tax=Dyadobacter sp. CY345 TaxID=2909335 RepID=UPI001F393C01|nr:hypothetical protein [Dyadobacter sp. CY345]MCF2443641.1 hypothetical protein [Dyadobacter sp. CY345]
MGNSENLENGTTENVCMYNSKGLDLLSLRMCSVYRCQLSGNVMLITSIERSVTTNEVKIIGLYYHKGSYAVVDIYDGQLMEVGPESTSVNQKKATGLSAAYDTNAVIVY